MKGLDLKGSAQGLIGLVKANWVPALLGLMLAAACIVCTKTDSKTGKRTLVTYGIAFFAGPLAGWLLRKALKKLDKATWLDHKQSIKAGGFAAAFVFLWDEVGLRLYALPGGKQAIDAGLWAVALTGPTRKSTAETYKKTLANAAVAAKKSGDWTTPKLDGSVPEADLSAGGYTPPATSPNPGAQASSGSNAYAAMLLAMAQQAAQGVIQVIMDAAKSSVSGVGRGSLVPRWNDPRWGIGGDRASREANLVHVGMQN